MPYPVKEMSQVEAAAASIASDRVTPVFAISSVTGQVGSRMSVLGCGVVWCGVCARI